MATTLTLREPRRFHHWRSTRSLLPCPNQVTLPLYRHRLLHPLRRHGCDIIAHSSERPFEKEYPPLQTQRCVLKSEGDDRPLIIETGAIGRQANGAVLAKHGDTVIFTTACCAVKEEFKDFVPLSVDYVEKLSSVGRTAQGFIKRERQRDQEVLTSRIIDRSIRPLFPEGWSKETQILETVMSFDGVNATEPLAITAAGAALALSDLPCDHPVVGVRVGWLDAPVIHPTMEQREHSQLDLVLAGTVDGVIMIEASANFVKERDFLKALEMGMDYVATVSQELEMWIEGIRKETADGGIIKPPPELADAVFEFCQEDLSSIFSKTNKKDRNMDREALWLKIEAEFITKDHNNASLVRRAYKSCESRTIREMMLKNGRRIDGRQATDIRPIESSANILPRTHGSSLFTRGNTQALCVATLGSQRAAQKIDTIQEDDLKRFYLQYFFPPSSVGEVRRFTLYPGRRELGHGQLASRALAPAVPDVDTFPYTIRLESTITESDGSSSMASVCGGYLAMMDAGVPLSEPVAGIAMGLMLDPEHDRFIVLSDIMGTEDALGDMDLKVTGTNAAISALQMDVKVKGVTFEILSAVLKQAKNGRQHILREMTKCDPPVRRDLSPYAPHISILKIDPVNNGRVIGPGGQNIRAVTDISGVTNITLENDGEVEIDGPSYESVETCIQLIRLMAYDPVVGSVLKDVEVTGIKAFGAFVDFAPGRTGLVHISELAMGQVTNVEDVVSLGDRMDVKVIAVNGAGKISLSRKALMKDDPSMGQPTLRTKPTMKTAEMSVEGSNQKPNERTHRSRTDARTTQQKAIEKTVVPRKQ